MPGKIFINYRREDTRADAARIRDRLVSAFGATNVFMDVDNLMAGQRFDQELAKALGETDIFLAVMGARWPQILYDRAQAGGRDYVREEIAQALARGIVVIPVMIERAPLPPQDWLPEDLKALVLHQKHDISHDRFGRDVEELVAAIKTARKSESGSRRPIARSAGWLAGATAALAVTGAGAAYVYKSYFDARQATGVQVVRAPREPVAAAPAAGERSQLAIEVAKEIREAEEAKKRAQEADWQRMLEARVRGEENTRQVEVEARRGQVEKEAARVAAMKAQAERQQKEADPPQVEAPMRSAQASVPSRVVGGYVAALGFRKSQLEAMRMMADLQSAYDLLRDKRLAIMQVDETRRGLGVIYRVVVGPRAGIGQARDLCNQLYVAGMPKQGCYPMGE